MEESGFHASGGRRVASPLQLIMQRAVLMMRPLALIVLAVVVSGCGLIGHKPRGFEVQAPAKPQTTPAIKNDAPGRKLVIFFDGTANDEGSDTNVKRLHSLVTLQDRANIASLYVLGVGTDIDPLGAMTGSGINARVRLAYEFVLNHYQAGTENTESDEIYIFGFSRGAFAARILATMLNYAGIVEEIRKPGELRKLTPKELSEAVHEATFPCFGCGDAPKPHGRAEAVKAALVAKGLKSLAHENAGVSVPVKVLGLWDTVQALGFPAVAQHAKIPFLSAPPFVDVDEPNLRYGERLCNVEHAYHALSIDDNRATIFTPLLLSRKHVFEGCANGRGMLDQDGEVKPGRLQEVWFSGAHSDVGGGYASGALSGVSLNWMVHRLKWTGLFDESWRNAKEHGVHAIRFVREDALGGSHDPRKGLGAIYPDVSRDLAGFAFSTNSLWGADPAPICMHSSVFTRRKLVDPRVHEYHQISLAKAGVVELAPGEYGKGRRWTWLRERTASDISRVSDRIELQSYPGCSFMPEASKAR